MVYTLKEKYIDSFLLFVLASGIIQFVYLLVQGTFPYNAFLASFICSVGLFCLTVNLRYDSSIKSWVEYCFSCLVLFGFAVCFIG
jgi:oligosaccharyltransferase complex subunit epsilon